MVFYKSGFKKLKLKSSQRKCKKKKNWEVFEIFGIY